MRKKLLSLVLCLFMITAAFPATAYGADETVSDWTGFIDAFNSLKTIGGGTITMTADITCPDGLDLILESDAANAIVINTDGNTMTIGSTDGENHSEVVFGADVTVTTNGYYPALVAGANGTLTVDGAQIKKTSADPFAVRVAENGHLELLSGRIQSAATGLDVLGTASISGGEISIDATASPLGIMIRENGEALITGGTVETISSGGSGGQAIYSYGRLEMSGGTVTADGKGATAIFADTGTAEIRSGTVTATDSSNNAAVAMRFRADTVIDGGTFQGNYGIWAFGGDGEINGGTVTSTGSGNAGIKITDGAKIRISDGDISADGSSSTGLSVSGSGSEAAVSGGTVASSNYQGIEVLNSGTVSVSGGTVTGKNYGIYSNDSCLVNISGGTVSAAHPDGSGVMLNYLCTAHISGDGAQVSGGGSNGSGITVELGSEANISGGTISGANGVYTEGEVNISGGTVQGTNGMGIRAQNSAEVTITDGDIEGTINGILINKGESESGSLTVGGGLIKGINCGIVGDGNMALGGVTVRATDVNGIGVSVTGSGRLTLYSGLISGPENGVSIGSDASAILYNGGIRATGEISPYSIFMEGNPSVIRYNMVDLQCNIYYDVDPESPESNYVERQSFAITDPYPPEVELKEGKAHTVDFMVGGEKTDGSSVTLQDQLGTSGTLSNTSYTISGNTITFTPISAGSAVLSFTDHITYNGLWNIDVNVTAAATPDPDDGSGSSGGGSSGGKKPVSETELNAQILDSQGKVAEAAVITLSDDKDTARVETDAAGLDKAFKQSKPDQNGIRTVIVDIPEIKDVHTFDTIFPAAFFTEKSHEESIMLRTGIASITMPCNILSGSNLSGTEKMTLSLEEGGRDSLSEEVRRAVGDRPLIQLTLKLGEKQVDWDNPFAPVTVSIPYKPSAAELANPEAIVIWYVDGSGNPVCIPNGRYDSETGMVVFMTSHFSVYAVAYHPMSYEDVASGAWYQEAISFIAAREITGGTGNGNFSPNVKLTRGQFLVMLMRAYGLEPDTGGTAGIDNFADAGNTYYTGYLSAAKRLGLSEGIGKNLFAPEKEITRQELFVLTYNVLKSIGRLPEGESDKVLTDFSDRGEIAVWAVDAMTVMVANGIVEGSGGKLSPAGTTTRAQMAQVIYNLFTN